MRIVIDLPEYLYDQLHDLVSDDYALNDYELAIFNGTLLPEGVEILTKEAYSDLCTRAADVSDFESKEYVEERIKNYDKMLKSEILDCVIEKPQESEDKE